MTHPTQAQLPLLPPGRAVRLSPAYLYLTDWPHNRAEWPTKHVLVCEDNLQAQSAFAQLFARLFGPDHSVQVTFAPGAAQGIVILDQFGGGLEPRVDLLIVDHDMPWGNGAAMVEYAKGFPRLTILGASGILQNNEALVAAGAHEAHRKDDYFNGTLDARLRELLA